MKSSKRFKKLVNLSSNKKPETFVNALVKVKQNCNAKFDESIDVSFRLNLKKKKKKLV